MSLGTLTFSQAVGDEGSVFTGLRVVSFRKVILGQINLPITVE
jgi:hypothetical protein